MSTTRNLRRAVAKQARKPQPPGPVELKIGTDGYKIVIVLDRPVQRLDFTADEAMGVIQAMHNNVSIIAAKARAVAASTATGPAGASAAPANNAALTAAQETPDATPPG